MLKPKKSGIDYSKMDSMSKYSEPKTGRISATSKDSVSPELQKKINAAKERALNVKQVASQAGKSALKSNLMKETSNLAARAAMKKRQ